MTMQFDYYYGDESEQFSFFRIPRQLVTGKEYKGLSNAAKLLYGLMLDRMGLSQRNGWYDAQGRVFIYYPVAEIQATLGCGHDKAGRLLAELERNYGLIQRVKQGQGRPARIYVRRFTTGNIPPSESAPEDSAPIGSQDCGKSAVQTAENPQNSPLKSGSQEVSKPDGNYTNKNYTDLSYINQSINPTGDFRKSDGKQDDEERRLGQQEKKIIPSRPLEALGNLSRFETHFRQKPTAGGAETEPEAAAAPLASQSAPAWNFDSKIPQVGGTAPKPPLSQEIRLKQSRFETHFPKRERGGA